MTEVRRASVVWAALIVLSAFSIDLGVEAKTPMIAVGVLLFLSFLKVWFVMNEYMEIRIAVMPIRVAMYAWLCLMWGVLTVLLTAHHFR